MQQRLWTPHKASSTFKTCTSEMSQNNLALETNRTYTREIPKVTAIQQRVLKWLTLGLTRLGPVTGKAGPGHPDLCGRGSVACLRAWPCSLSLPCSGWRESFFLTLKNFFLSRSLFYFPIRHHLSSCPPSALVHLVDTISFSSFKF